MGSGAGWVGCTVFVTAGGGVVPRLGWGWPELTAVCTTDSELATGVGIGCGST